MLLATTGDSKPEFVEIKLLVGFDGSPPPGSESVLFAPTVRLLTGNVWPAEMVIVAAVAVLITASVAEVGTPPLQLEARPQ